MARRKISPIARCIRRVLNRFRRAEAVYRPRRTHPYNVARKRGELKYLLLTESQQGGMMLRFVLRSAAKLAQLRAALPWLQQQLPQLKVITANIQPVHMAIMEGEQEIFLSDQQALAENFNGVPLWIRPQSFFQTNPTVASQLYATARDWVRALPVNHMWDLFCGVGGFGLHCATPQMRLTGIEIAPEAIACAKQSAAQLGLTNLHFQALDSTQFATHEDDIPQLVLVNPPRRGIGAELCDYLSRMAPSYIIYSSCTPGRWPQILIVCRAIALSGCSCSICFHIPRIMKC